MKVSGKEILIQGRLVRVAGLAADTYEFLEDPEAALDEVRRSGERIDIFTFMQRLPDTTPKFSYPMEWDNLAALPITSFDDWWNKTLGFKARNKAKQPEKKGVTYRDLTFNDDLARAIKVIYDECPVRQGKKFSHYQKPFETVRREAGTFLDRSYFIGAFFEDEMIGFAKLLCDETRTQAALVHIVSMIGQRDKAPTNGLIVRAVHTCAEQKIPYLVYSRYNDGNKKTDSLIEFKERNGFQQINLPRYYVPLTAAGRLAVRAGLHNKKLVDLLPEPVITKLRTLRNSWNGKKLQSVSEAS